MAAESESPADARSVTPAAVRGDGADANSTDEDASSARERILVAAGALFAERGFDATPTSRIAERAEVPKGLIHYYFRRKQDLLAALVERLPDETVACEDVAVRGDLAGSLRRLVAELDSTLESSLLLSHLLWREADTHASVRRALQDRFQRVVDQVRRVIDAALPNGPSTDLDFGPDVDAAAVLLARAVNHRHSLARLRDDDAQLQDEIGFVARALELRFRTPGAPATA